jgi:hypothetical protein
MCRKDVALKIETTRIKPRCRDRFSAAYGCIRATAMPGFALRRNMSAHLPHADAVQPFSGKQK